MDYKRGEVQKILAHAQLLDLLCTSKKNNKFMSQCTILNNFEIQKEKGKFWTIARIWLIVLNYIKPQ